MMYKVEYPYQSKEAFEKMTDDDYKKLRTIVLALPEEKDRAYYQDSMVIDEEGLNALFKAGVPSITIKSFKNSYMTQLEDKASIKSIEALQGNTHIHIPNIGLLSINKVCVLEDCCTNELQDYLNEGWRIIAICPPNGVRRPDYIIGKSIGE